MANAGLAERVDRLAWDDLGDQPTTGALGRAGRPSSPATLGRRRLRRPSTKHRFDAQDDECPRHWNSRPAPGSAPERTKNAVSSP